MGAASKSEHCRVYFQHLILNHGVVALLWVAVLVALLWVAVLVALLWVPGWFGVLGFAAACLAGWFGWLGCGWWVVGELYSGCFVSLFCVIFVFVLVFCFCGRSVDALVSRADEGRGGLRYALGS